MGWFSRRRGREAAAAEAPKKPRAQYSEEFLQNQFSSGELVDEGAQRGSSATLYEFPEVPQKPESSKTPVEQSEVGKAKDHALDKFRTKILSKGGALSGLTTQKERGTMTDHAMDVDQAFTDFFSEVKDTMKFGELTDQDREDYMEVSAKAKEFIRIMEDLSALLPEVNVQPLKEYIKQIDGKMGI